MIVSYLDKFGLNFFFIPNCALLDICLEKWSFVLKNKGVIWKEINVVKKWMISGFHDASTCVSSSDLYLILTYFEIVSMLWDGKCAKM